MSIRKVKESDYSSLVRLINEDLVAGQVPVTIENVKIVTKGQSDRDGELWEKLTCIETYVACKGNVILGGVGVACNKDKTVGRIMWLHTNEHEDVTVKLLHFVENIFQNLGCIKIYAFEYSTALSSTLEAFPSNRTVSRKVMLQLGYAEEDLWSYRVGLTKTFNVDPSWPVSVEKSGNKTTLSWLQNDAAVGELSYQIMTQNVSKGSSGIKVGFVSWLGVLPEGQGRRIGAKLLKIMLTKLYEKNIKYVALCVDDDAPKGAERDRSYAKALYDNFHIGEVDRLLVFNKKLK